MDFPFHGIPPFFSKDKDSIYKHRERRVPPSPLFSSTRLLGLHFGGRLAVEIPARDTVPIFQFLCYADRLSRHNRDVEDSRPSCSERFFPLRSTFGVFCRHTPSLSVVPSTFTFPVARMTKFRHMRDILPSFVVRDYDSPFLRLFLFFFSVDGFPPLCG